MLREAVEALVAGDVAIGKAVLRDYVNATIGFERRAETTQRSAKSSCAC